MLVKLDKGADDLADSFSSPRYGPCDAYPMDNYSGKPQYSLNSEGKKGKFKVSLYTNLLYASRFRGCLFGRGHSKITQLSL